MVPRSRCYFLTILTSRYLLSNNIDKIIIKIDTRENLHIEMIRKKVSINFISRLFLQSLDRYA